MVAMATLRVSATAVRKGSNGCNRQYGGNQNGGQFHQGLLHARVFIVVRGLTHCSVWPGAFIEQATFPEIRSKVECLFIELLPSLA